VSPLALLRLLRPVNLAALWAAVEAGSRLSAGPLLSTASLPPLLVAAFGYARNDAVDAAADRVNRPARPIPSEGVTPVQARAVGWACLVAGGALAVLAAPGLAHLSLFALLAAALFFYSPWIKERGPAGPATVALLGGVAVAWGGLLGGQPERMLAAAVLAASVGFARECAKDLEDVEGDRAAGKQSWPVRSGEKPVRRALRLSAILALFLVPVPWLLRDVNAIYLAVSGPVACPVLAWVAARPPYGVAAARRASGALKLALFAGIAGLWFGAGSR